MTEPVLYYDLASPYAYLAVSRAPDVLGVQPKLEPILLGAIFHMRGYGSWSQTETLDENVREILRRAGAYGLPPLRWPEGWPANSLSAMRAAVWATRLGAGREFAPAAYRVGFVEGRDIADVGNLVEAAAAVGLPAGELPDAIQDPELKQALKDATQAAWDAGVRGVPTVRIGSEIHYGDDKLELAAGRLTA